MRFIVLGDMHYSFYSDPALTQGRELFFDNLLAEIADLKPDLVFSIGDAVNEGKPQEFESFLNIIKKRGLRDRFLIVPGNHDVLKTPKTGLQTFLQPSARLFPGYELPETTYYSFGLEQAHFIVLDSAQEMNDSNWGGVLGKQQLRWLGEEIEDYNKGDWPKVLVVLAHHPLKDTTSRSDREMMNIAESHELWKQLEKLQRGRGLFFNGHNHVDSIATKEKWAFVQAGAIYRTQDYRVCDIEQREKDVMHVSVWTKEINDGAESTIELANRLGDNLQYFSNPENAKGLLGDRQTSFIY